MNRRTRKLMARRAANRRNRIRRFRKKLRENKKLREALR